MRHLCRLSQAIWRRDACRFLLAAVFAGIVGVAAGRAVLGSVVGSVSIVDGSSMAPTYEPGARVCTTPVSGRLDRGEIVLLDDGNKEQALKRIVGMPGETIQLWRGHIFINRKLLREPYLPKHTYTFPSQRSGLCSFRLGKNQFFVLGDNRLYSEDSRAYGPVDRAQINSRIQLPGNDLHAYFAPYTLPAVGKISTHDS